MSNNNKKQKDEVRYQVEVRESGEAVGNAYQTEEEAEKYVQQLEQEDKEDCNFTQDYYHIQTVNSNGMSIYLS